MTYTHIRPFQCCLWSLCGIIIIEGNETDVVTLFISFYVSPKNGPLYSFGVSLMPIRKLLKISRLNIFKASFLYILMRLNHLNQGLPWKEINSHIKDTTLPRSGVLVRYQVEDWVRACRCLRCYFAETVDVIFLSYRQIFF